MTIECKPDIKIEDLPWIKFHHALARISVKVKWASGVPASAGIIDRFYVNSVKVKGTSQKGYVRIADKVVDAVGVHTGSELELALIPAKQLVDYTDGIYLGEAYILPQAKRQPLILNYTITNGSGTSAVDKTMNYIVGETDETAISEGWRAGSKYTYEITIGEKGNISIGNVGVIEYVEGDVGDTIIQ